MKIISRIIMILVIITAVLAVGKNFIVKIAVEQGIRAATGLPLEIDKLDIGFASTHIGIEGLSLLNPEGFPKEAMLHSPVIFVDYNLGDMIAGKIHLEDLRLDFDRFVVVTNAQGQTNLDTLKSLGKDSKGKDSEVKKAGKKKKPPEIQIDHLSLKVGKLIYKDYSKGSEPSIKEFNINLSEELTDVTNIHTLLGVIATKALAKTALNSFVDFNTDAFKDAAAVTGQVADSIKNTAGSLTDSIKLPFGNN